MEKLVKFTEEGKKLVDSGDVELKRDLLKALDILDALLGTDNLNEEQIAAVQTAFDLVQPYATCENDWVSDMD